MAWARVSCPARNCGLNRSINGIGRCICGCLMIYQPSRRRTEIELPAVAFRWHADDAGTERVHVGPAAIEKRGFWIRLQGTKAEFPHRDRRKLYA